MKYFPQFLLLAFLSTLLSCSSGNNKQFVIIETDMGDMKVELYNSTPKHRDNFIKLVKENFYDDLLFHRVIQGFMVQGGDPNSRNATPEARLGGGGPGYLLDAEIGAPHFKGTLAAARTSNPEKRSSGSQFYLVQGKPISAASLQAQGQRKGIQYNEAQIAKYENLGGAPALDNEYTVFGEVVEGLEVIDKLAAVPTQPGDRPVDDLKMKIRLAN